MPTGKNFFFVVTNVNGKCRFFTYGEFNAGVITINDCCNTLKGFP